MWITFEVAGIILHHGFPLGLRDRILPQIKWLTNVDGGHRLLIQVSKVIGGPHQKFPGRNEHEFHIETDQALGNQSPKTRINGFYSADLIEWG